MLFIYEFIILGCSTKDTSKPSVELTFCEDNLGNFFYDYCILKVRVDLIHIFKSYM